MTLAEMKKRLDEIEGAIWSIEIRTDFLSWDDREKIRALNTEARALRAKLADIEK